MIFDDRFSDERIETGTVLMTLTEYRAYQAPAGFRDELLKGELILSPSASWKHSELCFRLMKLLERAVDTSRFAVLSDTTMLVGSGDAPRPDVYVISRSRLPENEPFPSGAPAPRNTAEEIDYKRSLYLEHGSLAVWIVDPAGGRVEVFERSRGKQILQRGDQIPLPAQIASSSIAAKEIFDTD